MFAKLDRDSTAITMLESNLLILVKKDLKRILKSNPEIEKEMLAVSKERRSNHVEKMCIAILNSPDHTDILRESCINSHGDPHCPIEFVKRNIAAYLQLKKASDYLKEKEKEMWKILALDSNL